MSPGKLTGTLTLSFTVVCDLDLFSGAYGVFALNLAVSEDRAEMIASKSP